MSNIRCVAQKIYQRYAQAYGRCNPTRQSTVVRDIAWDNQANKWGMGEQHTHMKQSCIESHLLPPCLLLCLAWRGSSPCWYKWDAKHWEEGGLHSRPHVVVCLLGWFKGETGIGYHILPVLAVTPSNLEPRKWIGLALQTFSNVGIRHRPIFRDRMGQRIKAGYLEVKFFEWLEQV